MKSPSPKPSVLPPAQPARVAELVSLQEGAIVSREVLKKPTGGITLFAFDAGEALSEHTAPFDAVIQVLEGEAEVRISGIDHPVKAGEMILMPAHQPHAVRAVTAFKMMLVMIREPAPSILGRPVL